VRLANSLKAAPNIFLDFMRFYLLEFLFLSLWRYGVLVGMSRLSLHPVLPLLFIFGRHQTPTMDLGISCLPLRYVSKGLLRLMGKELGLFVRAKHLRY
jgi:hypothetical protein